jgi:lysophospholipid acyltransferase
MMDFLIEGADALGSIVGLSGVQMRLMLCLFVSIPLAVPFRVSSLGATPRHLYSTLLGLFFLYFCFLSDALLVLVLPTVAYVLLIVLPRSHSHFVVLSLSFGYLSICHVHRMIRNYLEAEVDFSGALMIVVLKVTSVAFDYHDGMRKGMHVKGGKEKEEEEERKGGHLVKLPGVLEFFSYTLFFPSLTCGPFFDFADYREFMKGPRPWTSQSAYGCLKLCLMKLLWTFVGLLFFVNFSFIGRDWFLSNDFLVETPFHMKYVAVL